MNFPAARALLESYFEAAWLIARPTVPIERENVAFEPPENAAYVRISIAEGDSEPVEIGAGMVRCFGLFVVDIFVPRGDGTGPAEDLAQSVATIMNYAFLQDAKNYVTVRTARKHAARESRRENPSAEVTWLHVPLQVPYERDAHS